MKTTTRSAARPAATEHPAEAAAQAFGATVGEMVKSMTNLTVPMPVLTQVQADYVQQATDLWNRWVQSPNGAAIAPQGDKRFADPAWGQNPLAAYTAQMYLLNANTLARLADSMEGDEKTRQRVRFAVQQWIAAASPSNYLALNPEAQALALKTRGESLVHGLEHMVGDLRQGHLSQTDESVFEVGRNVAVTPGDVVFENALFQLIEYKPTTPKVYERPLLMVPPCINKYYILDLQPENSLIRHAVGQGHRVFVMSWRNPDESLAQKTWDDYIDEGVFTAIRTVQAISGAKKINTLGFCVGGTLLGAALAVLAARGEKPAQSMTLLTTFLDFSNTGVLDIFVDEAMVQMREMTLGAQSPGGGKLLKGQELASTFSALRPNDLVWNYVVGNYLKGETPPVFDLLYWNSDSTNLPGPMYCWYLRNTYLENNLAQPGKAVVCGVPVDLGRIELPVYVYGSKEDHIVPWDGAYRNTQVLKKSRCRFVLGASGHIAGVINPPEKKKRSHWIGSGATLPASHEAWFEKAREYPGSWWPDWDAWLKAQAGKQVPAPRTPGNRQHKAIEAAPGRYVRQKA